jgi:hypothetical protein
MAQVYHPSGGSWTIVWLQKLKGDSSVTYSKQMKLRQQPSLRHSKSEQVLKKWLWLKPTQIMGWMKQLNSTSRWILAGGRGRA